MLCVRCKPPQKMFRVVNPKDGSATSRCSRCSMERDCAYCPKCKNTLCLKCYNKTVETPGVKPSPGPGPIISDDFQI